VVQAIKTMRVTEFQKYTSFNNIYNISHTYI